MRWLLAGCCGLALIGFSVALNLRLIQKPRYYATKLKKTVSLHCFSNQKLSGIVQWYKADRHDGDPNERVEVKGKRFSTKNMDLWSTLNITDVGVEDNGMYFCKSNETWGSGSQITATKYINRAVAEYRTRMKDGLIVLQALLLAVCIAAILLRKQKLLERRDSIYEEPETDHIYEGLAIETCGGGLYEELSIYAQAEGGEAPWE